MNTSTNSDPSARKRRSVPIWKRIWDRYQQLRLLNKIAVWLLILSIPMGIIGFKFARPLWRYIRQANALRVADACLAQGDQAGASLAFRKAIRINPKNPEVWKKLATFLEGENSPQSIDIYDRLARLEPDVSEHRYRAAEAATEAGQWERVLENLKKLPPEEQKSVRAGVLEARAQVSRGFLKEGREAAQRVLEVEPDNEAALFYTKVARLRSGGVSDILETEPDLQALADSDSPFALEARRELVRAAIQRKDYLVASARAAKLAESPDATVQDLMLHMDTEFATQSFTMPLTLRNLLERTIDRPADFATATRYLIDRGQTEMVHRWLTALPEDRAGLEQVRQAKLNVALAQREWDRLFELVAAEPPLLSKETVEAIEEVRQSVAAGRGAAVDEKWAELLNSQGDNPFALQLMARLASAWEWPSGAERAFLALSKATPLEPGVWRSLYFLTRPRRDLPTTARILKGWMEADPRNREVSTDRVITGFLLQEDLVELRRIAMENLEVAPQNPDFLLTAGLILAELNEQEKAAELLDAIPEPARLSPQRGIYVAYAMARSGRTEEATRLLTQMKGKFAPTFAEEEVLIKRAEALARGDAKVEERLKAEVAANLEAVREREAELAKMREEQEKRASEGDAMLDRLEQERAQRGSAVGNFDLPAPGGADSEARYQELLKELQKPANSEQ